MIRSTTPALLLALVVSSSLSAPGALAQAAPTMVQAVPGSTDADRLADQMRRLATSPNDLDALLSAGELSLKLDDLGAAASFFTRAERVDPRNGRAKAGQGAILVHAERPGEALRYFVQAEQFGRAPATFAAERGLAYDLIGENDRAQRDYRLSLRTAADDETIRRYALSLGIVGKRELAERELQPLLRKSDRGAWRARAFIEAMAGNGGEAAKIATTMMPPGTAAGLQPFFERLPAMTAIDRAFAVHFGNMRSSPQRLADARLAPPMAALGPDPTAPRLASAQPVAAPTVERGKRKRGKKEEPVQLAAATPAPAPAATPLPSAPAYVAQPGAAPVLVSRGQAPSAWPTATQPGSAPAQVASVDRGSRRRRRDESAALANAQVAQAPAFGTVAPSVAQTSATVASAARPPATPVTLAQVAPATSYPAAIAAARSPAPLPERDVRVASSATAPARSSAAPGFTSTVVPGGVVLASSGTGASALPVAAAAPPVIAVTPAPTSLLPTTVAPTPAPSAEPVAVAEEQPRTDTTPAPSSVGEVKTLAAAEPPRTINPPATVPARVPPPVSLASRRASGTALASIVRSLPIPGAELGIVAPHRAVEPVAAEPTPEETSTDTKPAGRAASVRRPAATPTDAKSDEPSAEPKPAERRAGRRSLADKKAADEAKPAPTDTANAEDAATRAAEKKAADRKAAADKKKLADAKAAAAKKAEEDREAAAQKKLERANPERIWVQVAGGAYAGDLPKAWAATKAKGGDAFAGQTTGWTTPLRFTNRVLAGPFKTDEEARAFVNRLTAKGMGAFTFTSKVGQVVTRLPAK